MLIFKTRVTLILRSDSGNFLGPWKIFADPADVYIYIYIYTSNVCGKHQKILFFILKVLYNETN